MRWAWAVNDEHMSRRFPVRRLVFAICGVAGLCACGGGGGGGGTYTPANPPAVVVSISPSAQSNIDAGQALKFTATVENDASGEGVTWSASATGLTGAACGTLTNATSSAATYNAPASVSANLSITVTATSVADTSKSSSSVVVVSPPPSITTTALANATPNANYSATLEAKGGAGALTWTVTGGTLPLGLSLSASGAITGVPTASGTSALTVQVTDSSTATGGPDSALAQLNLTVVTRVSISTTSLPAGYQGDPYSEQIQASGGTPPYTWSITTGSLPPGFAIQPSSGVISGTPSSQGTYTFTVAAEDSSPTRQTGSQALSITIGAALPLVITTTTLVNATPNANYSATLRATGGVGALTWSLVAGALPTGLSLSPSGVIAGDPTVSGTSIFTVQVTDSSTAPGGPSSAQAQLSLTVVTAIGIVTASLPAGSQGVAYLAQIEASGGTLPYTWSVTAGSLPAGLTMQPSSGVISGSPASQGNFAFTVAVQDASPTVQIQNASLAITIGVPAPLAITTVSLLDGTINTPYYARTAAMGGTPPYTWTIGAGALPANLTLDPSTGAITGTPASTGTAYFTIVVTDSSSPGASQSQQLSITVDNAAEACVSSGNNSVLNGAYAFSLSGYNDAGFVTVVGSFTADGAGNIIAGEADTNGVLGTQQGNIVTAASSYSVGTDNRGCATVATPFGSFVTHFALGSVSSNVAGGGRMIEWDSPSPSAFIASGQLLRQTSSALTGGLNGSYVFRTVGWDPSPLGGREACAGAISASGNTFSGLEEDCNDAWTLTTAAAPDVAGTYTALDANGRGTGILALPNTNADITFYSVSGAQLLMLNGDPGPYASGEMDQQTLPAGSTGFSQASLNGNFVLYLQGLSLSGTATAASMATASADGSSAITITYYEDRAGTMQVPGTFTCAYSVDPSGRVTLSSNTQSCGGTPPVFYLMGLNAGFIVDASPGVDTGSFEPQSAGPFSNASLAGNFFGGTFEVDIQSGQPEVDAILLDGLGSINGLTDVTSTSGQAAGSPFLAGTYAVNADGSFTVSSSGGAVAGIVISDSKFVMFSPSTLAGSYPALLVMQK